MINDETRLMMDCWVQSEKPPLGASREPVGNVGKRRHDTI